MLKAKDQILRESLYNNYKGLDLTSAITNMEPGYFRTANNTDIVVSGAAVKRNGYTNILTGSVWGARTVFAGIEYQKDDSTKEVLVAGHTASGTSTEIGVATTSVTSFKTGMDNQRPSIIQFSALIFYFNGTDDFIYNGTTTYQIGIDPPAGAPSGTSNTNGSLVVGANYVAAYTYYNSTTGAESSPSPLSSAVTVLADPNDGITWSVSAGDPTTADTIRLYRTVANGSILYLDNTAAIGATSITSTQADAGLGIEMELDNTRLATWGTVKYAVSSNNRIFVTGFQSPMQNRVRFSKIGQEGPMPESYMAQGFVDAISNGGLWDVNIGLGTANESVMVLKKNSIGRLDVSGSYGSEIGVDNVIYEYKEISRGVTGASHWAITSVLNNMVWLGKDNIYMTDSTNVVPIANRISQYIKSLNFDSPEQLSAINDKKNRKIIFSVMTESASQPDVMIVGSYKDFPEFYWTLYTPGSNTSTHPGVKSASLFLVTQDDNNQDVYFGNNELNGKVYHLGDGTNDDELGIAFKIIDYPTSYGLSEEQKLFFKDIIYARGNGDDYDIEVSSIFDIPETDSILEETLLLSLQQTGAQFDVDVFDDSEFAGEGVMRCEHSGQRQAYYKQLCIINENADEPVTILGWTKAARPGFFK